MSRRRSVRSGLTDFQKSVIACLQDGPKTAKEIADFVWGSKFKNWDPAGYRVQHRVAKSNQAAYVMTGLLNNVAHFHLIERIRPKSPPTYRLKTMTQLELFR